MNIVLDSNILLHYKIFEDIPWQEELSCDDITVVLTAMVLEEIDKVKDGEKGKIQKRAKAVSSRIADILIHGSKGKYPVTFLESAYATNDDRRQYRLDRNDNQILYDVMKSDMKDVVIVSSDNAMLLRAKQQGLKIHQLDDKYLLKEELSKEEKDAQAAIKELERYKNRLPDPVLIFENGKNHIQIKRTKAFDREVETQKRINELCSKWPEKNFEDEQNSVLGFTFNNVSRSMIVDYNNSRNKFIEKSEKKIRLEVERDDLFLRMKEINIFVYNKGNASTGRMNIFVEIPEGVRLYWEESKRNVEYDEPATPSFIPSYNPIPLLSRYTTPNVEMWNMTSYIRDGELRKELGPLNHKLQQGLFIVYVDSATCPNFNMKWVIIDAELPEPVKGEFNVSFVETDTTKAVADK